MCSEINVVDLAAPRGRSWTAYAVLWWRMAPATNLRPRFQLPVCDGPKSGEGDFARGARMVKLTNTFIVLAISVLYR